MFLIKEITCGEFHSTVYDVKLGDKATYNRYYEIIVTSTNQKLKIGLQECFFGIEPQIELTKKNILIGAGNNFYIVNLINKNFLRIELDAPLYCFFVEGNKIVIVDEIDVICLNCRGVIIWKKEFDGIITKDELGNGVLKIEIDDGRHVELDVSTGKEKELVLE